MEAIKLARNLLERRKTLQFHSRDLEKIILHREGRVKSSEKLTFLNQTHTAHPEIPSILSTQDLRYKPLIQKAYFKPYTTESISPIKCQKKTSAGLSENDTKDIAYLVGLLNNRKN